MTLLAIGCAGWAFAAHGGRWSIRLDVLTHFAPLLLAGAALSLAYAFTVQPGLTRNWLFGFSLLGVVLSGALVVPEYLRPMTPLAPADSPGQIKLIQFNAWRNNRSLPATIDWLAAQDADIIVLEEAEYIGTALHKRLPDYHVTCAGCTVSIFSKAVPVASDVPIPAEQMVRPPVAGATFRDARGEFTVFGVHYVWPVHGGFQQAQGRVIARMLAHFPKQRLILTGDLNSTPWSFSRRREDALFGLERRTRALFTWPVRDTPIKGMETLFPLLPIDQIYAGPGWRTVKVERGPRLGSDHYPVIITLAPSP